MTGRKITCALRTAALIAFSTVASAPATADTGWPMYGGDYRNQRFSRLLQIGKHNVHELRPIWTQSLGTLDGLEATPLVVDGVLYVSSAWAHVFAFDARNGRRLWHYAPQYAPGFGMSMCCGPVHRGVAIRGELLYVATLDARVVAIDRATGTVRWERLVGDWQKGIITNSAPLVVADRLVVGIAGGEFGVRGYLKALDANYGFERWTTYTIPGPGDPGHETWENDAWQTGGGATWQTGAFDADRNLIYWGVGNPAPWIGDSRPGDNRWTDSLIALRPEDGEIRWGFQFTPHDSWDYDGNNAIVLADVEYGRRPLAAAMQANRNGFFYVLDRSDGKFVYAEPMMEGINWTSGIDAVTGRPHVNESMRPHYGGEEIKVLVPHMSGGSNWFPMAFNPDTNVAFIPLNEWGVGIRPMDAEDVVYEPGKAYVGAESWNYRRGEHTGHLKAFDVANRKWLWDLRQQQPVHAGVLATRSGLIFSGDQSGFFYAADQDDGTVLWRYQTGSGITASPVTYEIDGQQYVAILSGYGGNLANYFYGPRGGTLTVFRLSGLTAAEAAAGQWGPEENPYAIQPEPPDSDP